MLCHEARDEPVPRTPMRCPGPSPAARRFDWRSTSPPNTFVERQRAFLFESSAPFSSQELTGPTWIQADFEWTSEGTDEFLGHEAEKVLRPKSPDRCLVQTQPTSLKPVESNEVRDEGGTTRSKPTLPEEGRRQGTSVSVDNWGPDRCWAAGAR